MKLKAITGVLTAAHFVMSFVFTSLSFSIDRRELFSHPANRIDDMIAYSLDVCARARDSTYKLRTKCDNEFVFVHEFENSCLDAYAMNNTHFIANEFCHETSFIVSNV